MIQLDFVIIGAEKSGTTLLVDRLRRSPHVTMPANEVRYFRDPFFPKRERPDLYFSEGDADKLNGIKHPSYLGRPEVPQRIKAHSPNAKLIAILRNPIDRTIASYLHYLRHGQIPCIHPNVGIPIMFENPDASPKYRDIIAFGDYAHYLGLYLKCFPREQILVLEFETLTRSSKESHLLFDFLDLPVTNELCPLEPINRGTYDWGECRRLNDEALCKFVYDGQRNIIGIHEPTLPPLGKRDYASQPVEIDEHIRELIGKYYEQQASMLISAGLLTPTQWN